MVCWFKMTALWWLMLNELWGNHSGPTKHRRKPNGTLSHNSLIRTHLESVLQPLQFSFMLSVVAHVNLKKH